MNFHAFFDISISKRPPRYMPRYMTMIAIYISTPQPPNQKRSINNADSHNLYSPSTIHPLQKILTIRAQPAIISHYWENTETCTAMWLLTFMSRQLSSLSIFYCQYEAYPSTVAHTILLQADRVNTASTYRDFSDNRPHICLCSQSRIQYIPLNRSSSKGRLDITCYTKRDQYRLKDPGRLL
ncbi:hypothetical protein BDV97DRAFT_229912 [Delphinella strobiligena]|nr:hypothetical protein BDV97DRAFT_229912 [Delphinella strobiligena]